MAKIIFDNWKAITHAKNWCDKKDNPCGVYLQGENKSDCAHFIAHCLMAGGIRVDNTDPATAFCPHGLAVRNAVLVQTLRQLAAQYDNVQEIGLSDAIVGDIGFLDAPHRPYHAFMVCTPVDLRAPLASVKIYAHSVKRCCEEMDQSWRQWFSTLFRITDYS